jgi:hypothetical protein
MAGGWDEIHGRNGRDSKPSKKLACTLPQAQVKTRREPAFMTPAQVAGGPLHVEDPARGAVLAGFSVVRLVMQNQKSSLINIFDIKF